MAITTLTNTEQSRAGAMACLEALRVIKKIAESEYPETPSAEWWRVEDSAVAAMLHAAGNPSGFMAGFVAVFAEYVKADFSGCGYNLDSWEKPEAAMTDEEKMASRSEFDEEASKGTRDFEATEEDKEQAYQEAAAQARESMSVLHRSAEDFRRGCAKYVTKISRGLVAADGGYSFEEKTAEKIDQSITALGEIISGGDVLFSPAIHEQHRNEIVAEAFGGRQHYFSETEMEASIQRFMDEPQVLAGSAVVAHV